MGFLLWALLKTVSFRPSEEILGRICVMDVDISFKCSTCMCFDRQGNKSICCIHVHISRPRAMRWLLPEKQIREKLGLFLTK